MSNYALDSKNRVVSANSAELLVPYRCIECRSALRKRIGKARRAHFYHLHTTPHCRLYSKSIDHLTIQMQLKEKIPSLQLERPFPSILRIADLCWEEKKLILEIQCSLIDTKEIEARRTDYFREGYSLVWLLDDRIYNRRSLRLGEEKLRQQSGFFFSLKKGLIYDQFELFFRHRRLSKGPPLPVDLSRPCPLPASLPKIVTRELRERSSAMLFHGDLFERALLYPRYLERLIEQEESILARHQAKNPFLLFLKKIFYIGLEWLLEYTQTT